MQPGVSKCVTMCMLYCTALITAVGHTMMHSAEQILFLIKQLRVSQIFVKYTQIFTNICKYLYTQIFTNIFYDVYVIQPGVSKCHTMYISFAE